MKFFLWWATVAAAGPCGAFQSTAPPSARQGAPFTVAFATRGVSVSPSDDARPDITEKILRLTENPRVAVVVDAENVRGKTGFELDHADFLDRYEEERGTVAWTI